jgi:hypothetical protein
MSDSHVITLEEAAKMTRSYRKANLNRIIANAYEKAAFLRLLQQDGCVGIRCYFAMTTEETNPGDAGRLTLVMVGHDASGNDLYNRELAEIGSPCPIWCPSPNPLNSD